MATRGGTSEQHRIAGTKGGKVKSPFKGFGANSERARKAGSVGGRLGKKGKQLVKVDLKKGVAVYMDKITKSKEEIELSEELLKDLQESAKDLYGEPTIY